MFNYITFIKVDFRYVKVKMKVKSGIGWENKGRVCREEIELYKETKKIVDGC